MPEHPPTGATHEHGRGRKYLAGCEDCQAIQSSDHYHSARKVYYEANKEQIRATSRAYMKARRLELRAWLDQIKLEAGCKDCGVKPLLAEVLEFDHVRGVKDFALARATSKNVSRSRLVAEVEKCDVVCANCHRVRTVGRRRGIAT